MTDQRQNRIQSFAFVLIAFAAFCLACYFMPRSNAVPVEGVAHIEGQINPNTARLESLIRLPDIGLSRADAIIQYRNSVMESDGDNRAFETQDDLQKIKGIGPKTVQNMSHLLKFE